jgi:hypothetical protein
LNKANGQSFFLKKKVNGDKYSDIKRVLHKRNKKAQKENKLKARGGKRVVGWKLKSYLLRLLTLVRDEVKKENISRFKEKEGNEMCKQYVLSMIYTVCIVYGLVRWSVQWGRDEKRC